MLLNQRWSKRSIRQGNGSTLRTRYDHAVSKTIYSRWTRHRTRIDRCRCHVGLETLCILISARRLVSEDRKSRPPAKHSFTENIWFVHSVGSRAHQIFPLFIFLSCLSTCVNSQSTLYCGIRRMLACTSMRLDTSFCIRCDARLVAHDRDRKSTRLNSSHSTLSRMPSSA